VVVHTCHPSTQEDEAGELQIHAQLGLYSKIEASLSYIVRHSLKYPDKKVTIS
jgi:hypothetical protein